MFTPSDILGKQFKSGLGYDKKDVEQFLQDVASDYTIILQENNSLKKKLKEAEDSLAYYKSIEKTLQKALVLAEKTAQDTKDTAIKEAELIEKEAKAKGKQIIHEAMKRTESYEQKMMTLIQQYDMFKIHFENLLKAQQELLNSQSFSIHTENFTYLEATDKTREQIEDMSPEEVKENLAAITRDPEAALEAQEMKQNKMDLLNEDNGPDFQTEDGFEFFTMKEE